MGPHHQISGLTQPIVILVLPESTTLGLDGGDGKNTGSSARIRGRGFTWKAQACSVFCIYPIFIFTPFTKSCGFHSQIINWLFVLHRTHREAVFLSPLNDVTRDFASPSLSGLTSKCHELFGHRCNFQRCRWTWNCKWIILTAMLSRGSPTPYLLTPVTLKMYSLPLSSLVTLQNVVLNSPSHIVQARRLVSRFFYNGQSIAAPPSSWGGPQEREHFSAVRPVISSGSCRWARFIKYLAVNCHRPSSGNILHCMHILPRVSSDTVFHC